MSGPRRLDLEPGYVLHARPFRESSLVVEALTRGHGRLGLVARGARRPRSKLRGLLQPFTPLLLSWSGRGELATLTAAEPRSAASPLSGSAAMVGFYVNELVLRFVHRHDAEPVLFDHYRLTIEGIASDGDPEPILRMFEKHLLASAGYALELAREADTGAAIRPDVRYRYVPDTGPSPLMDDSTDPSTDDSTDGSSPGVCVSGATLLALGDGQLTDRRALHESKLLMRSIIDAHCAGRPLESRKLWRR